MVCISPHSHRGDVMNFHLCSIWAQQPCPVLMRLILSHVRRWRFIPLISLVGSTTRSLFFNETSLHQFLQRVLRSANALLNWYKIQNGFLDLSLRFAGAEFKSLWIGNSGSSLIFLDSLRAVSYLVMNVGAILLSTCNHSIGLSASFTSVSTIVWQLFIQPC